MRYGLVSVALFLMLAQVAHAEWCYQETANASTAGDGSCPLGYTGSYAFTNGWLGGAANLYDGNWSSSSNAVMSNPYYYVNYTKPQNALDSSAWQVKDGISTVNLSIPSSCWSYNSTAMIFRVYEFTFMMCLEPETMILTGSGQIPVKDVQIGERVFAYDGKKIVQNAILDKAIIPPESNPEGTIYSIYTNGTVIKSSPNHEFYANNRYVRADSLKIGDALMDSGLSSVAISNISTAPYGGSLFDLTINNTPNFFANGVLVHNSASRYFEWSCYNGTGYQVLRSNRENSSDNTISVYEEAMYWDISAQSVNTTISGPRVVNDSGYTYNVTNSFSGAGSVLNITASNITIRGNGFTINGTILVSGAGNVRIYGLSIDPAIGLLVNNTNDSVFSNLTLADITQYGIYAVNGSSRNTFANNTINSSAAGTLLQITDTSAGNVFYWNSFAATAGLYVNDSNGNNHYNATVNGRREGNLWGNVLNGSVEVKGGVLSGYGGGFYIGSSGAGYPYNNTTAAAKLSGNAVDWAPLTNLLGTSAGMGGANVTVANRTRWGNATSGAVTITPHAGNVTSVTHPAVKQLTDRWAAFFGNVSGAIALSSSASAGIYNWTWSPADNGGTVCVTIDSAFNFMSIAGAAASDIDTAWSFASDGSDNAMKTFNDGACSVNLSQSTATSQNRSKTGKGNAADLFYTCPLKSPSSTAVTDGDKAKLAFCSPIIGASGKNYLNDDADFELIAPTPFAAGSGGQEVYYFFAHLD